MAEKRLTNNVRTLRFLAGEMPQEELGKEVGVTRQTIAVIGAGKYFPSLESAFRIGKVPGKPLDGVFGWEK